MSPACLFLLLCSCRPLAGSGKIVDLRISLPSVRALDAATSLDIVWAEGPRSELILHLDRELSDAVTARVIGSTLVLREEDNLFPSAEAFIEIVAPAPERVYHRGLGVVSLPALAAEEVELRSLGAGTLRTPELHARRLELVVAGMGRVHVQDGEAERVRVDATGLGEVDLLGLNVGDLEIRKSGLPRLAWERR